jgi:4-hydroxybenzoate polyprenyltransferase
VIKGLFLSSHPFPVLMNGLGTLLVALLGAQLPFGQALGLMAAIMDTATAPHKPIVRGLVSRGQVLALSIAATVASLATAVFFGWPATAVIAVVLAAGMAYNFGLKQTVLSPLPYAAFIPSAAVLPFAAAGQHTAPVLLTYPMGALLSVGLNVANTIPDLESDAKLNAKGLTHRLGGKRAMIAVVLAFALTVAGLALFRAGWWSAAEALAVAVLAAIYAKAATRAQLRLAWAFSAMLAAVIAADWALVLRHMLTS